MKSIRKTILIVSILAIFHGLFISFDAYAESSNIIYPTVDPIEQPFRLPRLLNAILRSFYPEPAIDLSSKNWVQAFDIANEVIAREFAFSDQRNIDWDGLRNQVRSQIVAAEANHDKGLYYLALRTYITGLYESHTYFDCIGKDTDTASMIADLAYEHLGGSYGLIITKLDDGKYIASYVAQGGAAAQAGIHVGAQIIAWNYQPIDIAVEQVPLTWSSAEATEIPYHHEYFDVYAPSTQAGVMLQKSRLLVRAPINSQASITFVNSGEPGTTTHTLTANYDSYDTFKRTALYTLPDSVYSKNALFYTILPGGFGYIRVLNFLTADSEDPITHDSIDSKYGKIIDEFKAQSITRVIVDLRANRGGAGSLGCRLPGYFSYLSHDCINTALAYHRVAAKFDDINAVSPPLYSSAALQKSIFEGKVAVITDLGTISSGELAAAGFKYLSQNESSRIRIFSNDPNTTGSVTSSYKIIMPGEFTLGYAAVRAYDVNGNLLLESNRELQGGVAPDEKTPMTAENAIKIYTDGEDLALAAAKSWLATGPIVPPLVPPPGPGPAPAPAAQPEPSRGNDIWKFGAIAAAIGAGVVGTAAIIATHPMGTQP